MNKYEEAILVKHAYVNDGEGTKPLKDVWPEDFKVLEEACKKAQAFDILTKYYKINIYGRNINLECYRLNEMTQEEYELLKELTMTKYKEALDYFKNDSVLAMVCVANGLKERDYKEALYLINEAIDKANKYDELEKENIKGKH